MRGLAFLRQIYKNDTKFLQALPKNAKQAVGVFVYNLRSAPKIWTFVAYAVSKIRRDRIFVGRAVAAS
jgi:hypothetical protein